MEDLDALVARALASGDVVRAGEGGYRRISARGPGMELLADLFWIGECLFLRFDAAAGEVALGLSGCYDLRVCAAGGWLLVPQGSAPLYWLPRLPVQRRRDGEGRILEERPAELLGMELAGGHLGARLAPVSGAWVQELVLWRFPQEREARLAELEHLSAMERAGYGIYGSHTDYRLPADLYLHLIHGTVMENQFAWPHRHKIADELDAWALYQVCRGLERATGKRIYDLFARQLVWSAVARQAADGGWYHGEWTALMESHYRLHCGGLLMLADYCEREGDPEVLEALRRGTDFIVSRAQPIDTGLWFLHDSLETDEESIRHSPLAHLSSRVLGSQPGNLLVLNTHLDSMICVQRYREVSGSDDYAEQLASARCAAEDILARRPAESLYRALFRAIDWALMPAEAAAALPLPARVIKRLTWMYLIPRLNRIRNHWPRLVMPNGYIDRDILQEGLAHAYQSVNIWDLVRYRRRFPSPLTDEVIRAAVRYTQQSQIRAYWREAKGRRHALFYWAEALVHWCVDEDFREARGWLAEALVDLRRTGQGLPPALLGANPEAVPPHRQLPLPDSGHADLVVANLGNAGAPEYLLVNLGDTHLVPAEGLVRLQGLTWRDETDHPWSGDALAPGAWLLARGEGST